MISVFADQHMRQQAGAGSAALDRTRRQRRLDDGFAARAGFAGPDDTVHDKAARHILKLFGDIFAKGLQLAAAPRAIVAG